MGQSGGGGGSVGAAQSRTRTSNKQTLVSPQLAFLSRSGLGCGGCRALRESFPHRASLPFPQPPTFPQSAQWSQWREVRRTSLRSLGSGLGHGPTLDFRRSGRSAWWRSRGSPNVAISAVLVVYSRSGAVGYSIFPARTLSHDMSRGSSEHTKYGNCRSVVQAESLHTSLVLLLRQRAASARKLT